MRLLTTTALFIALGGVWAAPGYYLSVKPRGEPFGSGCKSIKVEEHAYVGPYLAADCSTNTTLIVSTLYLNQ